MKKDSIFIKTKEKDTKRKLRTKLGIEVVIREKSQVLETGFCINHSLIGIKVILGISNGRNLLQELITEGLKDQ